jgi:hypothetical protein
MNWSVCPRIVWSNTWPGVRRIGENRTLGVELEPNRFDLSAHRRGLDTMQSLGYIGGSARNGGMIENYVKATGLRSASRVVSESGRKESASAAASAADTSGKGAPQQRR